VTFMGDDHFVQGIEGPSDNEQDFSHKSKAKYICAVGRHLRQFAHANALKRHR